MKKIVRIVMAGLLMLSLSVPTFAATPKGAPCTGEHTVTHWTFVGSYYDDPPYLGACVIEVDDFSGLCINCNYFVGRTTRTQLKHKFGGDGMCIRGCGIGEMR